MGALELYGSKLRFWLFLGRRRFCERNSLSAFGAIDGEVPFVWLNLICHEEKPLSRNRFATSPFIVIGPRHPFSPWLGRDPAFQAPYSPRHDESLILPA